MQTDVSSKIQGVTPTHKFFTQSLKLCFANIVTAGAYLSRENIVFGRRPVGWGRGKSSYFSLPFHVNMSLYSSLLSHSLNKVLFIHLWSNHCGTELSLVCRLVHIHSWEFSFKRSTNFETYKRNSHGGLGTHCPQESLVLSQLLWAPLYTTVCTYNNLLNQEFIINNTNLERQLLLMSDKQHRDIRHCLPRVS